jgi:predicted DNA-binding protein (UPF0251 family)
MHTKNMFSNHQSQATVANQAKQRNFINCFSPKASTINTNNRLQQRLNVPVKEILSVLHLTQPDAAKKLGISLTTLKRRFKEMNMGRWPINSQENSLHDMNASKPAWPTSSSAAPQTSNVYGFYNKHLTSINLMNEKNQPETYIDVQTMAELTIAFKQYTK